ncbi:MAG TPA: ABC transporter ATP-binding protein [Ktedonobacterales bacterium]|nr:ABC transporter ATP-binding protein [Ktedonobacterales bacterium]
MSADMTGTPIAQAAMANPHTNPSGRAYRGQPTTIEVQNVSKWYGDKVAVSDLSFALGPGVTALLGPNGAGKSTTIKLLTGLLRPSRGQVQVLGQSVVNNPKLYRRIGLVPEQEGLYPFLSIRQFVELAARLHHLSNVREAANAALRIVELFEVADRPLGQCSKGMRQRAKIAQGLVHDPEILILDEPLSGADPRQRLAMMEVFTRLGETGKTILISSHILYEVERMGSNVLVMVNGKLAAEGDFHAIRALMDDRPRRVRVTCSDPRTVSAFLVSLPGTRSIHVEKDSAIVETAAPLEFHLAVPQAAQSAGAHLYGIEGLDEDLESVFRYLVN